MAQPAMPGWGLLDEKEEAELHKSRLLNVEEKPFKRITKRLQTLNTLAASAVCQAPAPPSDTNTNGNTAPNGSAHTGLSAEDSRALARLREDVTLDFAAFDSSVARLQFLLTANARERERYAADRGRILDTSQRVRDNTAVLRTRLEAARATLEQRRKFDELADQITANRMLRPRAEQAAALAKLEDECAQLERESGEYVQTWRERRAQFEKIMEESMRLRRQIRDEKEEVERREGMDDDTGDADGTPRHGLVSGNATPRPESGVLSAAVGKVGGLESGDASTPRPASTVGARTPARDGSVGPPGVDGQGHGRMELKVRPEPVGGFSRNGSRAPSREVSPKVGGEKKDGPGSDVEMDDAKELEESPESPLTPVPDDMPTDDVPTIMLEGKRAAEDSMDTT